METTDKEPTMMLTFQDFADADDVSAFVLAAIQNHKSSDDYKTALIADEYDAQKNRTIYNVARTIFNLEGVEIEDKTVSNSKIASNFFNRLNTQRCMYSLGNGVSFIDPYEMAQGDKRDETKEKLGPHFDHVLREAAYHALIHGRSYLFWNSDRVYEFKLTEFVPLLDEYDGTLRAGIRFWQLEDDRPLNAVLYEADGYTRFRSEGGKGLIQVNDSGEMVEDGKRAYKMTYQYTEAGDMVSIDEENYIALPIVTMYGSRLKQSTLVGIREAIDAFDLIFSGFANDLSDCAQIYWLVENYGGMEEDELKQFLDRLKLNHIANIDTSSGGSVKPYTQDIPTAARQAFLTEMRSRIYEDFGGLDVHAVAAGATNDHIDAAYQPMDENAADFEHWVADAIQALLSLQGIEDTPMFNRSRISNQAEQAGMVLSEAQYLDQTTILRKLPNLTPEDVRAVLVAREEEDMERMQMMQQISGIEGGTQVAGI